MVWPSLFQVLFATLVGYLAALLLQSHVQSAHAPRGSSFLATCVILLWIGLYVFPFLSPRYPALWLAGIYRNAQVGALCAGLLALLAAACGIAWSNAQAWRQLRRRIKDDAVSRYLIEAPAAVSDLESKRLGLMAQFGQEAGVYPRVVFSLENETPFLCATWDPIIAVPLPLLEARPATHDALIRPLKHVLSSNANRAYSLFAKLAANTPILGRMLSTKRFAMEVQMARQHLQTANLDQGAYLLRLQDGAGTYSGVQVWEGIGLGASDVSEVARMASRKGGGVFRAVALIALFVGSYTASWAVGRHDLGRAWRLLQGSDVVGWKIVSSCPDAHVRSLVGQGGVIPDGLVVDTSACRANHVCVVATALVRNVLPKGGTEATIGFKTVQSEAGGAMVEAYTLGREYNPASGWTHFDPKDFWCAYLAKGAHAHLATLHVGHQVGGGTETTKSDVFYGPVFYVKSGSVIHVSGFSARRSDTRSARAFEANWKQARAWLDQSGYDQETLKASW